MNDSNQFYSVTSKLEIARLLHLAQTRNSLVLMRIPGRPVTSLTTVLHADGHADSLYLDAAQDVELNHRMISGGRVLFETTIDSITLAFETSGVKMVQYEGHPALHSHLPEAASYAQRRDNFRMDVPTQQPATCELWAEHDYDSAPIRLAVRDISSTGLALADTAMAINVAPGSRYRCNLDLPGVGSFELSLRVVHHHDDEVAKGGLARRVGCQFDRLDGSTGIRIQSYVNSLQRELISRQRGLS